MYRLCKTREFKFDCVLLVDNKEAYNDNGL